MLLVSIALCTYNGEKYLTEQLDTLVNQNYTNLEIIVVDDGSTDKTVTILKDYESKFPFLKVYHNEKNLGYVKNFEKAISLCSGEYIALCDQDDLWNLNKISIQVQSIGENLLCYHDSEFINQAGVSMQKALSDVVNMYEGADFRPFLFFNSVSGHASLFKKELVNYALPFPQLIFHDRWLAYVATNLGSIKYLDKKLVRYRQHENSDTNILKLSRKRIKKELHGTVKIKNKIAELEILMQFEFNANRPFVEQLYRLYKSRLNSYFCPRLVIFMFSYFRPLLFISKKGMISKINFVFKHIWGFKLNRE